MQLDPGSKLLSDLVFVRTYSEKLKDGKKERVDQTINRTRDMHIKKFPHLKDEITKEFELVHSRHVVPSMRSMQFAGYAIERSNVRIFNCSFLAMQCFKDFADMAFISMNGSGVGYSVQSQHIANLPVIEANRSETVITIEDSKEAWADSIQSVLSNPYQEFDYSKIRPKGSVLSTGGTASGPESLNLLHTIMKYILVPAIGRKLTSLEVHDILCHTGDLVYCGGVRRTALISLFDYDDMSMLTSKHGNWWEQNPQRARANNSAVIHRDLPNVEEVIRNVLSMCYESFAGEPGIFLTSDCNIGTNPCAEISLESHCFCNLSEVNVGRCKTKDEFLAAVASATIIGTLQASYTDFNYIDPKWKIRTDTDGLLGVSITGQADNGELLTPELLSEAASLMKEVNADWAKKLGINPAARIGCTKPSGSTSAWLGSTSGVHAAHDDYYLRRVRVDKDSNAPIVKYLTDIFGLSEPETNGIVEKDLYSENVVVVTVPVCKKGSIKRHEETSIQLLERSKNIQDNWIAKSHNYGANKHNVSLTVSYKEEEREAITDWIVKNRDSITGISLLPFSGGTYKQMPFESITEEQYHQWASRYPEGIDLFSLDYSDSEDARKGELACAGGACEVY